MILQIGLIPGAPIAGGILAAFSKAALANVIQTLFPAIIGQAAATGFRPSGRKITKQELSEIVRTAQFATRRGERLITQTDPFTGGLVTFTEGQQPVALQLLLEATARREIQRELARSPPAREPLPAFSPQVVAEVQQLFRSVPPVLETGMRPTQMARIRGGVFIPGAPPPRAVSQGIQRRGRGGGPRFLSNRRVT